MIILKKIWAFNSIKKRAGKEAQRESLSCILTSKPAIISNERPSEENNKIGGYLKPIINPRAPIN